MEDNRGHVLAFYSFRGGIGQSTTIATVASLLGKWRRKILLVDCDLDRDGLCAFFGHAPGYTKAEYASRTSGFHTLLETVAGGTAANWREHVVRLEIDGSGSTLDILPGGGALVSEDRRWSGPLEKSMVGEAPGIITYLEALRRDWCAEYDFILIDSKPPLAYPNATWTLRLADAAILLLPTHEDVLERSLAVIDQSFAAFHSQSKHRHALVVPVTARYETPNENSLVKRWIPMLVSTFQKHYQAWAPGIAATAMAEKLKIQYVPDWSWRTPNVLGLDGPGQGFEHLARLIAHNFDWRSVDQYPALPVPLQYTPKQQQARLAGDAEDLYKESIGCRDAGQIVDAILLSGMAISRWRECFPLVSTQVPMVRDISAYLFTQLRAVQPSAIASVDPSATRVHISALAAVLCSLSALLARLGEHANALQAQQGGVDLRRHLAKHSPAQYEVELARSLHNHSKCLAAVKDRQNAIRSAAEAVAIRRRWSRRQPAKYALVLARSLANLALRFDEGADRQKALLALREAVVILRHLSRADVPGARIDLARTLSTLASMLRANGDNRKAASTMWEAVRLWMRIRREQPRHAFELAIAFDNFSLLLAAVNEGLLAITSAERAVQLLRQLCTKDLERFEPYLARSLNNLSTRLANEGYSKRALDAAQESVQIRTRLAERNPQRYSRELAQSLNNLSNRIAASGNWLKALDTIDKAVALHSSAVAQDPKRKSEELAVSLYNKSLRLVEADEGGLAMAAVEDTLRNVRRLLTEESRI